MIIPTAIAAGMMIAASYSLILEGWTFHEPDDTSDMSSMARTIIGAVLGFSLPSRF
jgi:zinc transporter, ZIP family